MRAPWHRAQDGPAPIEWEQAPARWSGDALSDIHGGQGTTWRKDANGAYYPDCEHREHNPYWKARR